MKNYYCPACDRIVDEGETELIAVPVPIEGMHVLAQLSEEEYVRLLDQIKTRDIRYHMRWGYSHSGIRGRIGSAGPRRRMRCSEVDPVNPQLEWLHSLGVI